MALPNSIDKSTPTGSTDPGTLDTIITGLKTAIEDILGIVDNTNISAAALEVTASGLKNVRLYDATANAGSAGHLQRNGADLTWHDGTSAKVLTTNTSTQTLTNKTLTSPTINTPTLTVLDNALTIQDNADTSKQLQFQLSGITASTTRTLTVPDTSDTLVTLAATQTLTNKTLTSPTLTTPTLGVASATSVNKVAITAPATSATLTVADGKTLTASNTLTLAGTDSTTLTFQGTDTYVGRATTDTLTNKTLTAPVLSGTITGTYTLGGTPTIITMGTMQASTSGTSIDFTSIPTGVKRITIMLSGVSTNGTSQVIVQIGDSGGIENTNYFGSYSNFVSGSFVGVTNTTAAFSFAQNNSASATAHGIGTLTLMDASTNLWAWGSTVGYDGAVGGMGTGSKALSATLDRVRITMANGTDTFDAGNINIQYER